MSALNAFLQAIKSKADSKPDLDGALRQQIILKRAPSKRANCQRGKTKTAAQSRSDLFSSHYEAKQRKIGITKLKFIKQMKQYCNYLGQEKLAVLLQI